MGDNVRSNTFNGTSNRGTAPPPVSIATGNPNSAHRVPPVISQANRSRMQHKPPVTKQFQPVPYSEEEHAVIQERLNKVLGPEYVSFRPGGGGQNVSYIEGWKALNLANEIFGFNGWSSELISTEVDFLDLNHGRYSLGLSVVVRITIKDGTFHEDFGYGYIDNAKSKAGAFEKCKKEAFTDGLKRCLRCFGNVLGNCLYDKTIIAKMKKFKVDPPELDKSDFHRDPLILQRENIKQQSVRSSVPDGSKGTSGSNQQPAQAKRPMHHQEPKAKNNYNGTITPEPRDTHGMKNPESLAKTYDLADFDSFVFSDDMPDENELEDHDMNDGIDEYALNKNNGDSDYSNTLSKASTPVTNDTNDKAGASKSNNNTNSTVPELVSFINAKLANILQKSPEEVSNLPSYNTRFVSNSIRRTVDPNKSVPIKRTEYSQRVHQTPPISKPTNDYNSGTPLGNKRMIGMPPSQVPQSKRPHLEYV